MKPRLSTKHRDFLDRIIVTPCMQDLRMGWPLTSILYWAYLQGIIHGIQSSGKTGELPKEAGDA